MQEDFARGIPGLTIKWIKFITRFLINRYELKYGLLPHSRISIIHTVLYVINIKHTTTYLLKRPAAVERYDCQGNTRISHSELPCSVARFVQFSRSHFAWTGVKRTVSLPPAPLSVL